MNQCTMHALRYTDKLSQRLAAWHSIMHYLPRSTVSGILKRLGRTTESQTSSGINISTKCAPGASWQGFYGRAAACKPYISGVKNAVNGLWGSGNTFYGVVNHFSLSV
ncbi:hypothetical protein AOLI_G00222810 [Acnodon oligacanthus]